jgi:hypothetical protein
MNFRFHIGKATEAACLFLERGGGQMNIMKLVKLLYLLDRLSLDRRGIPVCGGDYLSMRKGPVTNWWTGVTTTARSRRRYPAASRPSL